MGLIARAGLAGSACRNAAQILCISQWSLAFFLLAPGLPAPAGVDPAGCGKRPYAASLRMARE